MFVLYCSYFRRVKKPHGSKDHSIKTHECEHDYVLSQGSYTAEETDEKDYDSGDDEEKNRIEVFVGEKGDVVEAVLLDCRPYPYP